MSRCTGRRRPNRIVESVATTSNGAKGDEKGDTTPGRCDNRTGDFQPGPAPRGFAAMNQAPEGRHEATGSGLKQSQPSPMVRPDRDLPEFCP
jgi:hypothetical protein